MAENDTTKNVNLGTINSRIKYFIESILRITPNEFSRNIGKNRSDWLYRILKNEVEPGPKTLNQIFEVYPEHKVWILTGEKANEPEENLSNTSFENLKIDDKLTEIYKLTLGKLSMQEKDIMLLDRKVDILNRQNELMMNEIKNLKNLIQELIDH
ncbi:hypothetical protein [Chryseobacterium sp. WLY505]|uniref:hypothetical protein n=1 Tax=Chryseobacterium sp. WLY505 TaxID=3068892 RepID=UPI0027964FFA|nr:hypothetical protein [Chryseobacterium sp. WLY505]MDQ1855714.1 hypothetical protein [Chryseobacterium sp. WLY505]